jgi:copper chaperone
MSGQTTFAFTVADMTCGHCVRAMTKAVETAFPGAKVVADTETKRVTVENAQDAGAVAAVIAEEGYTPVAAA